MGDWRATKANVVLAALVRNGWQIIRQRGSHRVLARGGSANYVFAFHERVRIPEPLERRFRRHSSVDSDGTRAPVPAHLNADSDALERCWPSGPEA
jgi:predicted RNA binding protein YcfA (HicA-like mRNA interferase family)